MPFDLKTAIEVVGACTGIFSLLVTARAILLNLERSRRELAVKLIYDWANDIDWATSRSVKLATQLPPQIVSAIGRREATAVSAAFYNGMVIVLRREFPEDKLDDTAAQFAITAEQSAFIRFLWTRWLNRLEGTLAAWATGAADLTLMQAEFEPLVEGTEAALEALADIRKGLPVIEKFYSQMKAKKEIRVAEPLSLFTLNLSRRREFA
jgi:hypothetical protein